VGTDPKRAAELYRKGCDGGEAESCARLARLYQTGTGVDRDIDKANDLLNRACRHGFRSGVECRMPD
jgi:TPR repeat protein